MLISTAASSTPGVFENATGSISALGMSNRKRFTVLPVIWLWTPRASRVHTGCPEHQWPWRSREFKNKQILWINLQYFNASKTAVLLLCRDLHFAWAKQVVIFLVFFEKVWEGAIPMQSAPLGAQNSSIIISFPYILWFPFGDRSWAEQVFLVELIWSCTTWHLGECFIWD